MPEIQLKLLYFTLNINFSKKIFFRPLLLNETSTTSLSVFKRNLLKFITPFPNNVFNCHKCKGIKYLTRLRLGISHLREHKFKPSFQDTLNPFCSWDLDVERNTHFLLYFTLFSYQIRTLLSAVNHFDSSLPNINDSILTHILLFGKASLYISTNILILNATMNNIISTKRFEESLFQVFCNFLLYFHLLDFFLCHYVFVFETIHSYSFSF